MPWHHPPMELFHGTTTPRAEAILVSGPHLADATSRADFGKGFYLTENQAQARRWAELRSVRDRKSPALVKYTIDRDQLAELSFLVFLRPSNTYWSLVEHFRRYGGRTHGHPHGAGQYDLAIGPMCRSVMKRTVHERYDQISFHTDEALKLLLATHAELT